MKCYLFNVEGLAPQLEEGATQDEARSILLERLLRGNDDFGSISHGVEVE